MAIEKFNGTFSSEAGGVTVLINSVIQSIKDFGVLGLYTYLASKPDTWKPNAKELMEHTGYSKNKIYRLINSLLNEKLMTVKEIREKGQFSFYHYTVHLHRQPCPQNEDTAPCPQKPDAVFSDTYKTKKVLQIKDLKKNTDVFKNLSMQLSDVLQCNPYEIPEMMLKDWLTIRESAKAVVTATAWDRLNKELQKCIELNINPHAAFEMMVANGWKSLKAEWIKTTAKPKKDSSPVYDHESTEWINKINEGLF